MNKTKPRATIAAYEKVKELNRKIAELYDKEGNYDPRELFELRSQKHNLVINYDWIDKPFCDNGKWGLKDVFGNILVPAKFDDYITKQSCFSRLDNVVMVVGNKAVLVKTDGSGDIIENTEYDCIVDVPFTPMYCIINGEKHGYILFTGHVLLDCICDKSYEMTNGIITILSNGKWGAVYSCGCVIPPKFDEIGRPEFGEPLSVRIGNTWGYVNEDKEFVEEIEDAAYYVPE